MEAIDIRRKTEHLANCRAAVFWRQPMNEGGMLFRSEIRLILPCQIGRAAEIIYSCASRCTLINLYISLVPPAYYSSVTDLWPDAIQKAKNLLSENARLQIATQKKTFFEREIYYKFSFGLLLSLRT